jgi:hypothetical protein
MVRVNNLANDAASDQVKASTRRTVISLALLISSEATTHAHAVAACHLAFDNNFSINGLDTGKGAQD